MTSSLVIITIIRFLLYYYYTVYYNFNYENNKLGMSHLVKSSIQLLRTTYKGWITWYKHTYYQFTLTMATTHAQFNPFDTWGNRPNHSLQYINTCYQSPIQYNWSIEHYLLPPCLRSYVLSCNSMTVNGVRSA